VGEAPPADRAGDDADGGTGADGLRLCALTRAERRRTELIRFVLSPDGTVTADLAERLPGRGVWVTATRAAVDDAVRRGVFARGLKAKAVAPAELGAAIDRQLALHLRQSFAFANKAGLVTAGFTRAEAVIEAGRAAALVQAMDAADDGRDRLARKFQAISAAAGRPAPLIRLIGLDEMSLAIGQSNVVHAVLADGGQTRAFLGAALRLLRYRQSDLATELAAHGDAAAAGTRSNTEKA
jgi:predicted RNA-binding protein YlxR (DUF448 family)